MIYRNIGNDSAMVRQLPVIVESADYRTVPDQQFRSQRNVVDDVKISGGNLHVAPERGVQSLAHVFRRFATAHLLVEVSQYDEALQRCPLEHVPQDLKVLPVIFPSLALYSVVCPASS